MSESVEAEYVPAVREDSAIVRAAPGDVVVAFEEYRKIQSALDEALEDCTMDIRGKKFRKKNYWRAVATAFNLTLELVAEREAQKGEDWGFLVTYRATAPNGRYADGDGTCFASEKGDGQDTVHNVRAHAATRAVNRAISNLVGFGEVSAEEMIGEQRGSSRPAQRSAPASGGSETAFDQPLGFGKHKEKTWRQMTEGAIGGDRHGYLEWLKGDIEGKLPKETDPKKKAYAQDKLSKVRKCLDRISKRADADAAAHEPPEEEEPPLPDDGAEGF